MRSSRPGPTCCVRSCAAAGVPSLRLEIVPPPDGTPVVGWAHEACFAHARHAGVTADDPADHGRIPGRARCAFCGEALPVVGRHPFVMDVGATEPAQRFWIHADCVEGAFAGPFRARLRGPGAGARAPAGATPEATNRAVYAGGLLNRALDPATQPAAIREFLAAEEALLSDLVAPGARVVDLGCGTGRHLLGLAERLSLGVGVDSEPAYVGEANRSRRHRHVHFLVGDGAAVPLHGPFDLAVCLASTWGTMANKMEVLAEMRRLSPGSGTRLITVYTPDSVPVRREWYARLGHEVTEVTEDHVQAGGFRSEHFTRARLERLLGSGRIHRLGDVGLMAEA